MSVSTALAAVLTAATYASRTASRLQHPHTSPVGSSHRTGRSASGRRTERWEFLRSWAGYVVLHSNGVCASDAIPAQPGANRLDVVLERRNVRFDHIGSRRGRRGAHVRSAARAYRPRRTFTAVNSVCRPPRNRPRRAHGPIRSRDVRFHVVRARCNAGVAAEAGFQALELRLHRHRVGGRASVLSQSLLHGRDVDLQYGNVGRHTVDTGRPSRHRATARA